MASKLPTERSIFDLSFPERFLSLQQDVNRLFSGFPFSLNAPDLSPKMDVIERGSKIILSAELPGLEEKDVDITLSDGILTVRGEKKSETEEKDDKHYMFERSYGSFSRSIQAPEGIKPEDIQATMEKGVLKVVLPASKAKSAPAATRIEIKPAGK